MRKVANSIEVPLTTYREWELGRSIRSENLAKIANYFGVSIDVLSGREHSSQITVEERINHILNELLVLKAQISNKDKA